MYDEYDDAQQPQKSGSMLPWVLVTVVVVFAGVGVVAMKSQADQAVAAVEKLKVDATDSRKRLATLEEQRDAATKELTQAKADKDQLEKDKAELAKQVEDLTGQVKVLQEEAQSSSHAKRGHRRLAMKGKRRR